MTHGRATFSRMKCHDFYAFDVKVEMTVVEQSVALLVDIEFASREYCSIDYHSNESLRLNVVLLSVIL